VKDILIINKQEVKCGKRFVTYELIYHGRDYEFVKRSFRVIQGNKEYLSTVGYRQLKN
jgi:hypothetical protein